MTELYLYKSLHPFTISQGFGQNLSPLYVKWGLLGHNGLDCIRGYIKGKYFEIEGANVRAAHAGKVTYAGLDSTGGYGVVVQTTEQFLDKKGVPHYWKTIYWHLQPNIKVRVGQIVKIGDILASADNTGASNGSHLHFGLKPIAQGEDEWTWDNVEQNNGYRGAVDPLPYMSEMTAYEFISWVQKLLEGLKKMFNI